MPKFPKEVFLENSHGTVAISPIKDNNCFFTCSANIIDEKWEKPAFFQKSCNESEQITTNYGMNSITTVFFFLSVYLHQSF